MGEPPICEAWGLTSSAPNKTIPAKILNKSSLPNLDSKVQKALTSEILELPQDATSKKVSKGCSRPGAP